MQRKVNMHKFIFSTVLQQICRSRIEEFPKEYNLSVYTNTDLQKLLTFERMQILVS